jgi:surfeit locus 1 family protein
VGGDSAGGSGLRSLTRVYRFLLKPRWILSHLFVLFCVVLFINLGFWQLRRLHERKALNAEVAAAEAEPTAPLDQLLPDGPASTAEQVDDVQYRSVVITGTYAVDQQVLVTNRSNGGAPGFWVLTPLVRADGTAVVVNRGWIPFSYTAEGPWTDFDPPTGQVQVLGMVRAPQARSTSGLVAGPKDADQGVLRSLARVDVERLQQQVDEKLVPAYVDLVQQQPAQTGQLPEPVPAPELDEGPHLNYAGQWFIFATLTIIVYPLLLRRVARRRQQGEPGESDEVPYAEPGPTTSPGAGSGTEVVTGPAAPPAAPAET